MKHPAPDVLMALALSSFAAGSATAATIDGTLNTGATLESTQSTQTNFGDASMGQPGFTNGSELDDGWALYDGSSLYLFLGGNLESNSNNLEIFFDTQPGGQNKLLGFGNYGPLSRMGDDGSGNGLTFDSNLSPDFWIGVSGTNNGGIYQLSASYAHVATGGDFFGAFLGSTGAAGDGMLVGGTNSYGIRIAIDNSNTAGVSEGCAAGPGTGVDRGIELEIPGSALGCPSGPIKICAFVNGSSHDFVSNQVLGPLPNGTCNLGEPRAVNFAAIPGNQFMQVDCSGPNCNPTSIFGMKSDNPTGSTPWSIAMADLNGDGKRDIVTANRYGQISVLLGKGDGTFGATTQYGQSFVDYDAVAVGDLNADGTIDIAVTNGSSTGIDVLLGNGNGTFGAPTHYGTGNNPVAVAIGDLNGDGTPDIVSANAYDNSVSVLLGNGNGTFQAKTDYAGGNGPRSVAINDLNMDHIPDLVVGNGNVSVLLGNGNGTFGAKTDFDCGGGATSMAVGDLNGDGKLDLAVTNGTVSVLLGHGDGAFGASTGYGIDYASVAIGDVNRDGKMDLAAVSPSSNAASVLLGNGDGTFTCSKIDYSTGSSPYAIAIGDLNGDASPDLAVAAVGPNAVSILLNTSAPLAVPRSLTQNGMALAQSVPNPTPCRATIGFTLPHSEAVTVSIFDVAGRLVSTIAKGMLAAGVHSVAWDGRDVRGHVVPAGLYAYELRTGEEHLVKHLVLVH